jgi:hypothetical protein
MKRLIFVLSVFVMTVCTTMTICSAVTYNVIQLSEGSGDAGPPRINDSGHVVWEKNSNIYLYDGTTTTKISTGSSHGFSPDINNAGTVVWYFSHYLDNRFYVFNGSSITSIDVPYGIGSPQINNQGQFAWIGRGSDELDLEIFLYEGANIIQITDNAYDDTAFDINDNGIVVWSGDYGSDHELFVYDGTGITQFTDNFNHDVTPRINNAGQIVWNRDDSVTWHYFLYDGVSTFQLSTTEYVSWGGDINDHGMVVWYGADVYQDFKIFVYDGTTTVLSNPPYNVDVRNPRINNRGQVVWSADNGGEHEIFLYDGSAIIQLTDNDYRDLWPKINDLGHVTWRGEVGDWEVFLAVPMEDEGPPVGGIAEPIDKIQLLIPWMTFATIILLTIGIVVFRRVRK